MLNILLVYWGVMKKEFFAVLLLVSLMISTVVGWASGSRGPSRALAALAPFDTAHPGRGPDSHFAEPTDQAMAYALYALAAAEMKDPDRAKIAADWLVGNSRQSKGTGWGLDWSWDAFNDGSTNPADTIYGITVALAVRALLDTNEVAPNPVYAATARAALDTYAAAFVETRTGGFFPYSLEAADRKDVHNVNAALAAQYGRMGVMQDVPVFRELAHKAAQHIWANRIEKEGEVWWPYGEHSNRPNDSVHASYVVDGLAGVSRTVGFEANLAPALRHLKGFTRNGKVFEFPHAPGVPTKSVDRPARLWGVGMLLFVLADAGEREAAEAMLPALSAYQTAPGVYGVTPDDGRFMPRHQSHLLWGLARLERGSGF